MDQHVKNSTIFRCLNAKNLQGREGFKKPSYALTKVIDRWSYIDAQEFKDIGKIMSKNMPIIQKYTDVGSSMPCIR
jgi:hypothetical protein